MSNKIAPKPEPKTTASLIGAANQFAPNDKGKMPRNLKRKNFIEGKAGDDLFIQYLTQIANQGYQTRLDLLNSWHQKQLARLDNVKNRIAGKVLDPKAKLERQIAKMKAKLAALYEDDKA